MQTFASVNKNNERSSGTVHAQSSDSPKLDFVFPNFAPAGPVLHRKAACACGGGCAACRSNHSTNLKVSQPNDPAEIEADQIADRVMRMPAGETAPTRNAFEPAGIQNQTSATSIKRKCDACENQEEEETIQRKPLSTGGGVPYRSPVHVREAIGSGGQPLEAQTRNFFEPRLGYDLGTVRVHTGAMAENSARAINAKAYALGGDIVFGSGEYKPESETGKHLIAHELAHTIQQTGHINRQDMDAGVSGARDADVPVAGVPMPADAEAPTSDAGTPDAGLPDGGTASPDAGNPLAEEQRICGPDVTSSLTTMLGTVAPWFRGLTGFQQSRSCAALGPGGFIVGVNPIMAWDTRQLFLPDTGWLDSYFRRSSCGSPRDSGCDTDPTRHLCETAGTCGNSVVVGGKCMLAGTANYALFGKMCRVCHDYTGRWNRWDMRAVIGAYKTISGDDSTPPKEVASAAYDGTFPTLPAAAENRGTCTGRCGRTHSGSFDFIWEPYRPR